MQVALLSIPDAAMVPSRKGGLLSPLGGDSPDRSDRGENDELRDRVKRDDQHDAQAAATLVPTSSSDVINDAERNVDASSRTFRRQVTRDGAAEQFRQDRQAFRQALSDAREKGTDGGVQRQTGRESRSEAKGDAKANASPDPARSPKASAPSGGNAAKATGSTDVARTTATETVSSASATARASTVTVMSHAASGAASESGMARGSGVPASQSAAATGRVATAAAAQAGRPTGSAGPKGAAVLPTGVTSARGVFKAGASSPAKAGDARAAESADREANIERIVRVIRGRISGERSHTVMRLDPPELGSLRLQMDLRGSALSLRIEPTTQLAHRLLSEDVGTLREGLEASGIQLERVEVRPPPPAPEATDHDPSQHADPRDDPSGGSAHTDAEHPQEQGKESHLTPSIEPIGGADDPEPVTESLVNVVA